MVAVVVIVGLVVVVFGTPFVVNRVASSADRVVRRRTHATGCAEAQGALRVTAPVATGRLLEAVVTAVNGFPSAPPLVPGIHVKERAAASVHFGCGSRVSGDQFDSIVRLTATADGCRGTYQVLRWKESGATIEGRGDMTTPRTRVEEAVRAAAGTIGS